MKATFLLDVSGKKIRDFDTSTRTLHLDGIAEGTYFLQISTSKTMLT